MGVSDLKLIMSDRPLDLVINQPDIHLIDLSALKITNCVGCYGCWTKTPGKCVIRDDAVKVYPLIAESDAVIYVSRLRYGGYDTLMKTMLERAIPVQQAFIRLVDGETHHVQRDVRPKSAVIVACGDISDAEKRVFKQLVARNSHNMNFTSSRVIFTTEQLVEKTVANEVKKWQTSSF